MDKTTNGWVSGMVGVLIFSGSLPAPASPYKASIRCF
jgi:hypothetical protein